MTREEVQQQIDEYFSASNVKDHAHVDNKIQHSDLLGLGTHDEYIQRDGSVDFTGEQSMGTNKLTEVVDPSADQDAATKKYHDDNKSDTITCVAGENISGADRPYAVFLSSANDRVYIAEADQEDEIDILGFATTTATTGNNITVQTSGVVGGFLSTSNLTAWDKYYLAEQADTWWGSAPFTNIKTAASSISVGIAISTTQLLIIKPDDRNIYSAGDKLISSSDGSVGATDVSYTKIRETEIVKNGTLRIKFTLTTNDAGDYAYGKIYKNGVAIGAEQKTKETGGEEFSADIAGWKAGDLVQIYYHRESTNVASVTNFRIYADKLETTTAII